jgi:hypothetical protein
LFESTCVNRRGNATSCLWSLNKKFQVRDIPALPHRIAAYDLSLHLETSDGSLVKVSAEDVPVQPSALLVGTDLDSGHHSHGLDSGHPYSGHPLRQGGCFCHDFTFEAGSPPIVGNTRWCVNFNAGEKYALQVPLHAN